MKVLIKEKLSPHKYKDNSGYLICTDCILARTGKQTYTRDELFGDGDNTEIEVNREESEVFNPKTLASFENKPLTIEHPNEDVNPSNYNDLAVGYIRDVHKGTYEGKPVMMATIVITNEEAIQDVESGSLVNLSCGYDCDVNDDDNPCQKNIRGNHVALCEIPRAGITKIVDSKRRFRDMVMTRPNAIDLCLSLGKQFIKHFHKIYTRKDDISLKGWVHEMATWFNKVSSIKLKSDNKPLNDNCLRDWFFHAGAYPEDIVPMTEKELNDYNKFVYNLLNSRNVKESLRLTLKIDDTKMKDTISIEKIIEEIKAKGISYLVKKYGLEDFLDEPEYVLIVEKVDDNGIEVRGEYDYEEFEDFTDNVLNPIIQKYDKDSYFEGVEEGIWRAYLDLNKKTKDSYRFIPSNEYTDEELNFINMAESVIAYASNRDIDTLLEDRYLQKYMEKDHITYKRAKEILEDMLDDLIEVKEGTYTDYEGLSYNSAIYKDYPLYNGISFKEEDEEYIKDLIHQYALEDYAIISDINRYGNKTLSFEIMKENKRVPKKLLNQILDLLDEIYDYYHR